MIKHSKKSIFNIPRIPVYAVVFVSLLFVVISGGGTSIVTAQQTVPIPQPTVPEYFTLQGQFIRIAYNNEGFVTLGYRYTNSEVGKEWGLLDVGITMRKGVKDYTLKREALTLRTPDGKTIPLATQKEFAEAGHLRNLNMRANKIRDSIDYFPMDADSPCALRFFSVPGTGAALAFDQVELSYNRACVGRIYFHIPGGIQVGQHWLDVQFAESMVQVPFRVLTEAEEKEFRKKWEDIKKQHEESMKQ